MRQQARFWQRILLWRWNRQQRLFLMRGGLVFTFSLLVFTAACDSHVGKNPPASPTPTLPLIQNITPGSEPLFASVAFTSATTYDQAIAILVQIRRAPVRYTCDGVPSREAYEELFAAPNRSTFPLKHTLFFSYPSWNELTRLVSSPHIVQVTGVPATPCP